MEVTIDFNEKLNISNDLVSSSTNRNIGYFFLQQLYHQLDISSLFKNVTADSRITFDPNLVNRFPSPSKKCPILYRKLCLMIVITGFFLQMKKYQSKP